MNNDCYEVNVKCVNCGFIGVVEIFKMTPVSLKSCPTCSCEQLVLAPQDLVRVEAEAYARAKRDAAVLAEGFDRQFPGPYEKGIPGNVHPFIILQEQIEALQDRGREAEK